MVKYENQSAASTKKVKPKQNFSPKILSTVANGSVKDSRECDGDRSDLNSDEDGSDLNDDEDGKGLNDDND